MNLGLFSFFDPSRGRLYQIRPVLFWVRFLVLFVVIMFPIRPFMARSRLKVLRGVVEGLVLPGFKRRAPGEAMIIGGLFFLLGFVNFLGLLPWGFSLSRQLVFTFSLAAPLWLGSFLAGGRRLRKVRMLVGSGIPRRLAVGVCVIEFVGWLIRPVTLRLRLTANMLAGHLVLGLLAKLTVMGMKVRAVLGAVLCTGYYFFEFGICLIQTYVFCLLLRLYVREWAGPGPRSVRSGSRPFSKIPGPRSKWEQLKQICFLLWQGPWDRAFFARV